MTSMRLSSLIEWYRAHRYAGLFYVLLFTLGLHPLIALVLPGFDVMDWLVGLSLLFAVAGVELGERARPLLWLAAAGILIRGLEPILGEPRLLTLGQLTWALACFLASGLIVRHAFRRGVMDSERIFAGLDAYLLAGLAFGVVFWALQREVPGSFGPAPLDVTPQLAVYMSLTTISTLGPADITPMTSAARGLVAFEAVAGQIYLAVLVARLVSLYATRESKWRDE